MVVLIYIPTNSYVREFTFLHTISSIYCLYVFDDGHSDLCEVMSHLVLILLLLLLLSHWVVSDFATPWTAGHQASLSFTIYWSLLKLMSIESVVLSSHLVLCCPLLLLPSVFPSIRVFSSESALCIRWPKYQSISISHSSEYSGLISFRMGWFDLLAVQGTLKGLLQHHSSEPSILPCSACFMVQLSHPYMTSGKTVALIKWTFVGKVTFLLFNMLSRFAIAFLPKNKF